MVPSSLIPLWCLTLCRLVTVPVWSQGLLYLSWLSPPYPSVVLRRLPSVCRPSLGYSPPFSFSSPSLWSVLEGAALRSFLLLAFWSSLSLPLSFWRRVLWGFLLCWWCVPSFSPRLVGGFLQGLRGFAVPLGSGMLFLGLSLFCAFGLSLFSSLPSFLPCSSGVFAAWWLFFSSG